VDALVNAEHRRGLVGTVLSEWDASFFNDACCVCYDSRQTLGVDAAIPVVRVTDNLVSIYSQSPMEEGTYP
jgi:hypothetical protein